MDLERHISARFPQPSRNSIVVVYLASHGTIPGSNPAVSTNLCLTVFFLDTAQMVIIVHPTTLYIALQMMILVHPTILYIVG